MQRRNSERGAALLTVLLLVAIIATLAGTALERMRLATRLAGNAAAIEQARAFSYAAETLATTRVTALLGNTPQRVTLAGGWSGKPFALPLPGGVATAEVIDGGNCFNLNGLVHAGDHGDYVIDFGQEVIFARLLRQIGIPQQVAISVAAATADWIDTDNVALPDGAEDSSYVSRGYVTGNTLMADPSELRAVLGVTPEVYAKVRPWLCTLPVALRSMINVNTLTPEQAPLLKMLMPETVSIDAVQQALLQRPPEGFASIGDFLKLPELGGASSNDLATGAGVTTRWFALTVDVTQADSSLEQRGIIDAGTLPARLVSRQWGEPS